MRDLGIARPLGHLVLEEGEPPVERHDDRHRGRGRRITELHHGLDLRAVTRCVLNQRHRRMDVPANQLLAARRLFAQARQDRVAGLDRVHHEVRDRALHPASIGRLELEQPVARQLAHALQLCVSDESVGLGAEAEDPLGVTSPIPEQVGEELCTGPLGCDQAKAGDHAARVVQPSTDPDLARAQLDDGVDVRGGGVVAAEHQLRKRGTQLAVQAREQLGQREGARALEVRSARRPQEAQGLAAGLGAEGSELLGDHGERIHEPPRKPIGIQGFAGAQRHGQRAGRFCERHVEAADDQGSFAILTAVRRQSEGLRRAFDRFPAGSDQEVAVAQAAPA